jgi:lipoyl(octanoyl) transferase
MENWRLLHCPPQPGRMNMAIDESLLQSTVKNASTPVLRLYAWDPACLSLGFAQPFSDVDEATLREKGWDFVRRPTGGRAILHTDELTYSFCAPLDAPAVQGSVLESYRRLSGGLLEALNVLGVSANADKEYANTQLNHDHPVCFEVPSNYEVTANGKKLIGSAQSRKMGGVLQHGTLPLFGDIARINDVLNFPDKATKSEARKSIYAHATTLEEVLGKRVSWDEAVRAFALGFEKALGVSLSDSTLSVEENQLADALFSEKYDTRTWNCK